MTIAPTAAAFVVPARAARPLPTPAVHSEYGPLRRVLVHRPGGELARVTERNRAALLFERVPDVDAIAAEHDRFADAIRRESGAEVLYLETLLLGALGDERRRRTVVERATRAEGCAWLAAPLLDRLAAASDVLRALVEGLTAAEARRLGIPTPAGRAGGRPFLLAPLPNLYFMRDPAFVVGDVVVPARMRFRARAREADLVACALGRDLPGALGVPGRQDSVEGGDVLVLGPEAIAVGRSERTSRRGIAGLAGRLFAGSSVRRVYEVPLPARREFMHLDTVVTLAGPGAFVAHSPALGDATTRVHTPEGESDTGLCFPDVVARELPGCAAVEAGGGDAARGRAEQLTDAANLFALAPGKAIAYGANRVTNRALRRAGVEVVEVEGSELVKGLGGPRCMTLPLERDALA